MFGPAVETAQLAPAPHFLRTNRLTTTIALYWSIPLDAHTASLFALLPHVLTASSARYPTTHILRQALADLYGATLTCGVMRKGAEQVLTIEMTVIDPMQIDSSEDLIGQGVSLLLELAFNPLVNDLGFDADCVEKQRSAMGMRLNTKKTGLPAAVYRCAQATYGGAAWAIDPWGDAWHLARVTGYDLYAEYLALLTRSGQALYVSGPTQPGTITDILNRAPAFQVDANSLSRRRVGAETHQESLSPMAAWPGVIDMVDESFERLSFFVLSFRSEAYLWNQSYHAAQVANLILGGNAHSMLYKQLRQKQALAYQIYSWLDPLTATGFVAAIIERADYERVKEAVFSRLESLRTGHITIADVTAAKHSFVRHLYEIQDDGSAYILHHWTGQRYECSTTPLEEVRMCRELDMGAVLEACSRFTPCVSYFSAGCDD